MMLVLMECLARYVLEEDMPLSDQAPGTAPSQ
jgi:hypothetical protein